MSNDPPQGSRTASGLDMPNTGHTDRPAYGKLPQYTPKDLARFTMAHAPIVTKPIDPNLPKIAEALGHFVRSDAYAQLAELVSPEVAPDLAQQLIVAYVESVPNTQTPQRATDQAFSRLKHTYPTLQNAPDALTEQLKVDLPATALACGLRDFAEEQRFSSPPAR